MKILVVEDEHKIANSLKKGLEQESYVVDLAYDGIEGYDLASSEPYEIIILDLMLPGMDGVTLCNKLRENKIHTPVLMLTAKGELSDKVEGLNGGADDYMTKPFAFEELLARIRALSRRPQTQSNVVLKFEGLSLNTVTYEISREGKTLNLSRKEFSLLEFLMRHPNTIFTKEQLIERVWSINADVLPNTVEVYIGYLRKKVDGPFRNKPSLIHTVRGFGYKLSSKQ